MKFERLLWAALVGFIAFCWVEARDWHTEVARASNRAASKLPDYEAAKFWRAVASEYDR